MPLDPAILVIGEIVLYRVGRNDYLHLVNAIDEPHSTSRTTADSSTAGSTRAPSSESAFAPIPEDDSGRSTASFGE
jgi:hypothetical protein